VVTGSAAPYTYTITPIKVNAQALIEQIHNLDNRGTMNGFGRLLSRDEFVRARQVSGGQVESAHGPETRFGRVPGQGRRTERQRSVRPSRKRSGSSGVQKLPVRRLAISRSSSRRVSGFSPDAAIFSAIRRTSRPSLDTGAFGLLPFLRDVGEETLAMPKVYRRFERGRFEVN